MLHARIQVLVFLLHHSLGPWRHMFVGRGVRVCDNNVVKDAVFAALPQTVYHCVSLQLVTGLLQV